MFAMEPNLVETPFCLARDFLLKAASLRSVKHRNITSHSYFRCKSSHWSLQSQKYLKFQLFHHDRYMLAAISQVLAFIFLGARFYMDPFVLKRKTLIYPKKSPFQSSEVQCMHFVRQATRCCLCWMPSHCFFILITYSKLSSFK